MSADNISKCPRCHKSELREHSGMNMSEAGILSVEYYCECWNCKLKWRYSTRVHMDEWDEETEPG